MSEVAGTYTAPAHGWTCFHCGETFTTWFKARDHFGNTPIATTACQYEGIDAILRALRSSQAFGDSMWAQREAAQLDAARWRYARQFLAIEDIEKWSEMRGHQPDENESARTDAAIDAARCRHSECIAQEKK